MTPSPLSTIRSLLDDLKALVPTRDIKSARKIERAIARIVNRTARSKSSLREQADARAYHAIALLIVSTISRRRDVKEKLAVRASELATSLKFDTGLEPLATYRPNKAVWVIAHRGGKRWAPENTLAAFRKCVEHSDVIDAIELDVYRCKTGELVVIHDFDLSHTTDGTGYVHEKTLNELRALRLKGSSSSEFADQFADEKIPLLTDVLQLVDGKLTLHIEIKNTPVAYPGIEEDLVALLASYPYPDKVVVCAFDHAVVKRVHELAPQYRTTLLNDGVLVNLGEYAQEIGATGWNPHFFECRDDLVVDAHAAGVSVSVWTVNTPADWQSVIDIGVDGVITDDPLGLAMFLKRC